MDRSKTFPIIFFDNRLWQLVHAGLVIVLTSIYEQIKKIPNFNQLIPKRSCEPFPATSVGSLKFGADHLVW